MAKREKEVALVDKPTLEILSGYTEGGSLEIGAGETRELEKERLLRGLEHIITYIPTSIEVSEKQKAINGFVREYFSLMIRERYPQVSEKILDLKRRVELTGINSGSYGGSVSQFVDIPCFVHAEFGVESEWKREFELFEEGNNSRHGKVELSSKTPAPTLAVREKAKEAIAYFYELESKALAVPVLGDLLLANRAGKSQLPRPAYAELRVLWKPKPEEIKMQIKSVDPDPILVSSWQNRIYAVTTWDVKEEEPYMHYLKEFKL